MRTCRWFLSSPWHGRAEDGRGARLCRPIELPFSRNDRRRRAGDGHSLSPPSDRQRFHSAHGEATHSVDECLRICGFHLRPCPQCVFVRSPSKRGLQYHFQRDRLASRPGFRQWNRVASRTIVDIARVFRQADLNPSKPAIAHDGASCSCVGWCRGPEPVAMSIAT